VNRLALVSVRISPGGNTSNKTTIPLQNQWIDWSGRQDSNLPQPIDIVQGGSDNHARYSGNTRAKQLEILTFLRRFGRHRTPPCGNPTTRATA
jgi:hypothetical protein